VGIGIYSVVGDKSRFSAEARAGALPSTFSKRSRSSTLLRTLVYRGRKSCRA